MPRSDIPTNTFAIMWLDRFLNDSLRSGLLWRLGGFGLLPQLLHVGEGRLTERAAGLSQPAFDESEPAPELGVGAVERRFRVDLPVSPEIDHREQQIAELVAEGGAVGAPRSLLQFRDFLGDLVEHRGRARPVEADLRGLVLELQRP